MAPKPSPDYTSNRSSVTTKIDTKTVPTERITSSPFCLKEPYLLHHHKKHIPKTISNKIQTYIYTIASNISSITIATNLNSILY